MSIEQALADNTAAIKALTKAWESLNAQARAISTKVDKGEADKVNIVGVAEIPLAKVEEKKPAPTPAVVETQAAKPETATEPPSETPTMAQLSAAVTAAATRNREGLVAALTAKGVKRAGEIPQDHWAAFIAEVGAL